MVAMEDDVPVWKAKGRVQGNIYSLFQRRDGLFLTK